MPSDQLNTWITEGIMAPTHILQRLTKRVNDYGGLRDEEYIQLKQHFDSLCTNSNGEPRLTKTGFLSSLKTQATPPPCLTEAGFILFDSLRYLSQAPFSHIQHLPESLTLEESLRALTWTNYDKARYINREGNLCRGRTPADHRRVLFQSLATTRDGEQLPFDPDNWREQAERRAFDELAEYRLENAGTNCDKDGDEMYHDVVDVVFSTQPEISEALAPVFRDEVRVLAKELHGDCQLNQLSIPPERLCELVKSLLVAQFGDCGMLLDEHVFELECVAGCIIRQFQRVPGVGITWPMFDDAASVVPLLFNSVYTIASTIIKPPEAYYSLENVIPEPGRILTLPRLTKLVTVLYDNVAWDEMQLFHHYNLQSNPDIAVNLANAITTTEGPLFLLISGKIIDENEERNKDAVFGVFIADNANDGTEIQPKRQVDWDSILLFQLSPVHDIFRGTVGKPGWEVIGEELCFGERDGGVALALEKDLGRAILMQNVDGKEGVYEATEWRGNWNLQVEVKEFEIWGYE